MNAYDLETEPCDNTNSQYVSRIDACQTVFLEPIAHAGMPTSCGPHPPCDQAVPYSNNTKRGEMHMVRVVQSSIVEKSVIVVDILAQAPGKMNQMEIIEQSGINKSSVYRILSILVGQGLVDFDEREKLYSVGPKLVNWARAAWQKTDLSLIEDQDLAKLSAATGLNVAVSVLSETTVTFIRTRIPKPYKFAVKVGGQSELHCTAAGKIFLAYMSDTEQAQYFFLGCKARKVYREHNHR